MSEVQEYECVHAIVKSEAKYQAAMRLFCALVNTNDHRMVALEGLEGQLLLGLDAHLPQLGDFLCEDGFGRGGRVDTVGLDGDDDAATDLEEETGCEMLADAHFQDVRKGSPFKPTIRA